jgi:hypothetical protein
MKYSKWDEVVLKVADSFGYKVKVTTPLKVMIIGYEVDCEGDDAQYLCYVPSYERIPFGFQTFQISQRHVRHFEIEPKFIGDVGCFITAKMPIYKHIRTTPGEKCNKCGDWHDNAVKLNDVFICHSCKNNPYR